MTQSVPSRRNVLAGAFGIGALGATRARRRPRRGRRRVT